MPEPKMPEVSLIPPICCRSVNPIQTRGGQTMPTNSYWPPQDNFIFRHPWIGRVMRTFSLTHIQIVAQLTSRLFYAVRNKGGGLGTHAPKGNIVNIAPNWCRYLFKYWEEFRERVFSKSDKCQNIIRLLLSKVRDRYIHVNLVIASIRSTHQVSFNHNISRNHFFLKRLISLQHCGFSDENYNFKVEIILKGSLYKIWTPLFLKTKRLLTSPSNVLPYYLK